MKPFAHIRRMLPLVALTTAAVTATITTSAQTASGLAPAVEQRIRMNTSSAVNANWTFRFGGPYYSHLFIDKIYAKSDPIIPCQSVFDVQIAARLGFKFIEANVHATATPGKYIVMHGVRGCPGRPGHRPRRQFGRRRGDPPDALRHADEQIPLPLSATPNTARTSPRWRSSCWNAAATTSHR